MRKLCAVIIGLILFLPSGVWAALVEETITITIVDNNMVSINDSQNFKIDAIDSLAGILSFRIDVSHLQNKDDGNEQWFIGYSFDLVDPLSRVEIGTLDKSHPPGTSGITTEYFSFDNFDNNNDIFENILNSGLYIHFWATKSGNSIQIHSLSATARGNPVPIPGAVWLLGSGLACLGLWRRKSARKNG